MYVFFITRKGILDNLLDRLLSASHSAYKEHRKKAHELVDSAPSNEHPHYLLFDKVQFRHPRELHQAYRVYVPEKDIVKSPDDIAPAVSTSSAIRSSTGSKRSSNRGEEGDEPTRKSHPK